MWTNIGDEENALFGSFSFGLERLLLVFLHPLVGLSPVSTLLSLFHSQVGLFQPSLGLFSTKISGLWWGGLWWFFRGWNKWEWLWGRCKKLIFQNFLQNFVKILSYGDFSRKTVITSTFYHIRHLSYWSYCTANVT